MKEMKVEMRLLKSETIKDIIKHGAKQKELGPRKPTLDVSGATCLHENFLGATKCGRPVVKDAPHGWLCSGHLNQEYIVKAETLTERVKTEAPKEVKNVGSSTQEGG